MAFWTAEKILQEQGKHGNIISPFYRDRVRHCAYELALGGEALVTGESAKMQHILKDGEHLPIPPGQFAILLTREKVCIPKNAIGFISIRFTIKCQGLINVSGFHVDPGFAGHLKFAVYNAGSQTIFLSSGDRIFLIWLSDLSEQTSHVYDGEHLNQDRITSDDARLLNGEVASPAELKRQIDEIRASIEGRFSTADDKIETRFKSLEDKITTWRTATITFLSAITVLVIGTIITLFIKFLPVAVPPPATPPAETAPAKREAAVNQDRGSTSNSNEMPKTNASQSK